MLNWPLFFFSAPKVCSIVHNSFFWFSFLLLCSCFCSQGNVLLLPWLSTQPFCFLFQSFLHYSILVRFFSCFLSGGPITGTTLLFEPGRADSLGRGDKIQVSIYPLGKKNQVVKPSQSFRDWRCMVCVCLSVYLCNNAHGCDYVWSWQCW